MEEKPNESVESVSKPVELDPLKYQMLEQSIRDNQNLGMAIAGGLGAGLLGALVWALITYLTNYQIGWMAIGVGFLVGYSVRHLGKGLDIGFGIVGGVISILSCAVGNLLTICISVANVENMGVMEVIGLLNFEIAVDMMKETFSPMDVLFYALAVYYGYKTSFYKFTTEQMTEVTKAQ